MLGRLLALGLAWALLVRASSAQILGGPEPPRIDWEQRPGAQVPLDTQATDHDGRSIALRECFGERPVVLALVYYECPMLCDLVFEGLLASLRALDFEPGRDFELVALSIDPRETSELARAKRASCLERFGRGSGAGWRFLVADEPAIRSVAEAVGFGFTYVPERDEYAHAAGLTVLTASGQVSRVLFGVEFAPRDLRFALIEASEGEIGTPLDAVLLRCFHYDPARGRYGFAILGAIRFFGVLTVVALAVAVARMIVRERGVRAAPPSSVLEKG